MKKVAFTLLVLLSLCATKSSAAYYTIWAESNKTLYFTGGKYISYTEGGSFTSEAGEELTITILLPWESDNSNNKYAIWRAMNEIKDNCTRVVFESGFYNVQVKDCSEWFEDFVKLESVVDIHRNLYSFYTTSMEEMFRNCKSLTSIVLHDGTENCRLNTRAVKSFRSLFEGCDNLEHVDIRGLKTDEVLSIENMFLNCPKLKSVDISTLTCPKVTAINSIFRGCTALESADLSHINTTNLVSFSWMFTGCTSLKSVNLLGTLTNNINKAEAISFTRSFDGCSSLTFLDLSNFKSKMMFAQTENYIFRNCTSLKAIVIDDKKFLNTLDDWSKFNDGIFLNCINLVGEDGSTIGQTEIVPDDGGNTSPTTADGDMKRMHSDRGGLLTKKYVTVATTAIGGEYWASYYKSTVNRKAEEGTMVYSAVRDGSVLRLTEIRNRVIKAGQGVIMKRSTEGSIALTTVDEEAQDELFEGDNLLGEDKDWDAQEGLAYFELGALEDQPVYVRHTFAGEDPAVLTAKKAYIVLPENLAPDHFTFDILESTWLLPELSFDSEGVDMVYGEPTEMPALVNPHSLPVTYVSSNPEVATVNDAGEVTVLAAGTTYISAVFVGDDDYYRGDASYRLTVTHAASGIAFTRKAFIAGIGKPFTAPQLTLPDGVAVTYTTSNPLVAEVDAATGAVAIQGEGTADITAAFPGNAQYSAGADTYYIIAVEHPEVERGDVNGDGAVTITDAVTVVNIILGQ